MTPESVRNEAGGLHLLDEPPYPFHSFSAAGFGEAHCLLYDHKPARQQPQARSAPGISFQLLSHPCSDVRIFFQECLHHGWRRWGAHDLCMLQRTSEIKVVGAPFPYDDAASGKVNFIVGLDGGFILHQVCALDQHVRFREGDAGPPDWVDRKEPEVSLLGRDGIDRLSRGIEHDKLKRQAKAMGKLAGQVY
ncbi:hypothetical protein CBM2637_B140203 [Cupriavidus taiwanensis]|nr:hypothetical protein CBM2637_B140203 [Cupriavidus taiwanensis]